MTPPPLALHVAGRWLTEAGAGHRPVLNPATGQPIGPWAQLPLANVATVQAAAESAARGFALWRRTAPLQRCTVLRQAAALMRARVDDMATTLTAEQGKPLAEARREVLLSADIIDFQAEEAQVACTAAPSRRA